MNNSSMTIVRGDSSRSIAGRWEISSPAGLPPLRFFLRAEPLRFETGGVADRIGIDPNSTTLEAVFRPLDYDVLSKTPLEASLADSDGAVIVELDAPRQVKLVRLLPGTASGSGNTLEFYRLDGSTLAEKPTTSIGVQNNVATFPSAADFTDVRFAIRLKGPGGRLLRATDLAELRVRGHPTGPRLGIADPEDVGSAVFFWQTAGEVGRAVPADLGNVEAGQAFAEALGRHLDTLFPRLAGRTGEEGRPLPEFVDVALIAASDAPCVLDVTAFDVTHHLVVQSFLSGGANQPEKQVLRFSGSTTVQELSVRLPGNATVESATLETVESFREERLLASGDSDGPADAALPQREGVHVGAERWVAQVVTPPRAMSVRGIAVALMATTRAPEVLVEVQEDGGGEPSGRKLAATEITLGQAGRRGWVTLLFPEEIVLPSEPHWILMKAASGKAIWLADAGDAAVRVLEGHDESGTWAQLNVFDGLQAMYRFLSRTKQAQERAPVSLTVGEHIVEATGRQDDIRTYDLTSAINEYLGRLLYSTAAETIPLTFTSTLPGLITVYPPTINYNPRQQG